MNFQQDGNMYVARHPDGREIVLMPLLTGTARITVYGARYPLPQHSQAW